MANKGKIYKLYNNINDIIYIGSTQQKYLSKRKAQHKEGFLGKVYNGRRGICSSKKVFEGENCVVDIVLLEIVNYDDKDELRKKEREYYEKFKDVCCNKQVPTRTKKEYKKDTGYLMDKKYREENKEKLKKKKAEYYQKNKEEISKKHREYDLKNKQKRNKRERENRERKKLEK